jgi:hypothetical protein
MSKIAHLFTFLIIPFVSFGIAFEGQLIVENHNEIKPVDASIVCIEGLKFIENKEKLDHSGEVENSKSSLIAISAPCNKKSALVNGLFYDNLSPTRNTSGILCGFTTTGATGNLTDADTTNFAGFTITGLDCALEYSVKDLDIPDTYPAGYFAGFKVSSLNLVSGSIDSKVRIETYNDGSFVEGRDVVTSLLGIEASLIDGAGNATLGFVTTGAFDEIRIKYTTLVGVLFSGQVYHAVIEKFCPGPALNCNIQKQLNNDQFPTIIELARTGISGAVCIGCSINNSENVISMSTSDSATITLTAALGTIASISVKDVLRNYPAGTFAGFNIRNLKLVGLDVLSGITISTYKDSVFQENSTVGGTLLSLNSSLLNGTGEQLVGFVTTMSFDEIKFEITNLLGVANVTQVFSAVVDSFCVGPVLPCNEPVALTVPEYPVYVNGAQTGIYGGVCVGCSINNTNNLLDSDTSNYASIVLLLNSGISGSISVKDALTDYSAGHFAGFDILNTNFLSASLLDAIKIKTYLNGVPRESKTGLTQLLSVNSSLLTNDGRRTVGFITSLSFDEVTIELDADILGLALGTTRVYGGIFEGFCNVDLECNKTYWLTSPEFPVIIDGQLTGVSGGVCVGCSVSDAPNVISTSNLDYGKIVTTVGALGVGSIAVLDAIKTYPQGSSVGFTIEDENALVQLDLFNSLTICTYNNGMPQECKSGTNLLELSLLGIFIGPGPGIHNVGFKTTLPYDEIRISAGSLVSLINRIRVYGAFVDTRASNGDSLVCCYAGEDIFNICAGQDVLVTGTPNGGTWSQQVGNPVGAIVGPTVNGVASVSFTGIAVGVYKFIYATSTCTDTMSITVNAKPNAGPDQDLNCITILPGLIAFMNASGTGSWSPQAGNPGTAIIVLPNSPTTTIIAFTAFGTYHFIWTNSNGCKDTVAINITSFSSAGIDIVLNCVPILEDAIAITSAVGLGMWSEQAGNPGTSTITLPNLPITTITDFSAEGIYHYIWTNITGCKDTISITITKQATAGIDITLNCVPIIEDAIAITAAVGIGSWSEQAGNPGTSTILLPNLPVTTITDFSAEGMYHYIWTTVGGCKDTITITITKQAIGGIDITLNCVPILEDAIAITAAVGIGSWSEQAGNPGTSTILLPNLPVTTITDFSAEGIYHYIWTTVGGCKDTITITITKQAIGGIDITLNCVPILEDAIAITAAVGIGSWSEQAGNPGTSTILLPNLPVTTITDFSVEGMYHYIWTTVGGCKDTIAITITKQAIAGIDITLNCVPIIEDAIAITAAIGIGTWTAQAGNPGTSTITLPNLPVTTITDFSAEGTYHYIWTTVGGCKDTISITITKQAIAGIDITLNCVPIIEDAIAITAAIGIGTWTAQAGNPGTSTITLPNLPVTTITDFSAEGIYHYIWTTVGGCKDTISITISRAVTGISDDSNVCGGQSANLIGTPVGGIWSELITNPSGATLGATIGGVANVSFATSANGLYNFKYTFGTCSDTVGIIATPKSNAGNDQNIGTPVFPGGVALMNGSGIGTWSALIGNPGTATITDINSPTTTITNFSVAGSYGFVFTNSENCSDTAMVVASLKLIVEICNKKSALVNGLIYDNLVPTRNNSGIVCVFTTTGATSNLTDPDSTNFAGFTITGLGCAVEYSVKDIDIPDTYPAGYFAGFKISSLNLVSGSIGSKVRIETYNDGVFVEGRDVVTSLIGIEASIIDGAGNATLGFITTGDFDEIRIQYTTLVGVLFSGQVYHAVIEKFCPGPAPDCNIQTQLNNDEFPSVIELARTGITGIACIGCSINNSEHVISMSTSDFATINLTAAVGTVASISVKDVLTNYPAGTFAGFNIKNLKLVGLDLLSGITIRTYKDSVLQESSSVSTLLSLNSSLLNGTGEQLVGFVTTQSFDEIKFEITNLLGVLNVTQVYSAVIEKFCPGPMLPCNEPVAITSPEYPVFVNGVHTGINGIACIGCSVNNTNHLLDSDTTNYASIIMVVNVGTTGSISVKDQLTDYSAGNFAGFDILNTNILNATLLDAITVRTYLDGVLRETKTGLTQLVSVNSSLITNDGRRTVGFVTNLTFDEVTLELDADILGVELGVTRVYSGILEGFCPVDLECNQTYWLTSPEFPVIIDGQLTGISGGVCVGCSVANAPNVITGSNTDFGKITTTVGAIGKGSIAVLNPVMTFPQGSSVGFTIEDENALIQLDLFNSLTICTYNNGVQQECKSGTNLLELSLLGIFIGPGPGIHNVGFKTSLPCDEVRISAGSLVSLINRIRVYGAFVDTRGSNGDSLVCCFAGEDIVNVCGGENVVITGTPNGGTWSQQIGNPAGAIVGTTVNGVSTIIFTGIAIGVYHFIYATSTCSDTMNITVDPKPNAGVNQNLSCITLPGGLATVIANIAGVWTAQSGNPGAATITTVNSTTANITNFNAAGVYNFIFTTALGCSDTLSVTITSKPSAGIDISNICGGQNVTLTGSPSGGTWTEQIGNPPGVILDGLGNGVANAHFGTTAFGTYNFIFEFGSCTDTLIVSVNAKPNAGLDQTICAIIPGGVATLNSTGVGSWSAQIGNPGTANIVSPLSSMTQVNNFSSLGVYHFIYTTINNCSDTVSITVNQQTIGSANSQTICSGQNTNVVLNATIPSTSFSWTAMQLFGATINGYSNCGGACSNSIVQALTNTSNSSLGVVRYTVIPTAPNGCVGNSFIVDVTVNPIPIVSISNTASCIGLNNGTAHAEAILGTPAYTYLWSNGLTTADVNGLAPTSYIVTVSDANGCSSTASTTIVQQGISSLTAVAGSCNSQSNNYVLNGSISLLNPPTTGTLTIHVGANQQVFLAPFTSPQAYSLNGLIADGLNHVVTATFSDGAQCSTSTNFIAPENCISGISHIKSFVSATQTNPFEYNLVYKITVNNNGAVGSYDLSDIPGFDNDVIINSASFISDAAGNPGNVLIGNGPWILANDQLIAANSSQMYTITINVTIDLTAGSGGDDVYTACGSTIPGTPSPGEGLYNASFLDSDNDGISDDTFFVCSDLPYVVHNKTIASIIPLGSNMYIVNYKIVVNNLGGTVSQYDLIDQPGFDDDFMINSSTYTSDAAGNPGGNLVGNGPWVLANNQSIGIGSIHTYNLAVKLTLNLAVGSGGNNIYTPCETSIPGDPSSGEGLFNQSYITTDNDGIIDQTEKVCADVPYIISSKSVSGITPLGGNMYMVNYALNVTNIGGAMGQYDLVDQPGFDDDIAIGSANYTSDVPGNLGSALVGSGPWIFANNQTILSGITHHYNIIVKLTFDLSPNSGGDNVYTSCGSTNPGGGNNHVGLFNKIGIDLNNDGIADDSSTTCADLPYITSTKIVNSISPLGGNMYNVVYKIVVTNVGGANGQYDLMDTPGFDDDITIGNAFYTSNAPGNAGNILAPVGPWILANDQTINANVVHTYFVTVKLTLDLSANSGGNNLYTACGQLSIPGDLSSGEGIYNRASIDSNNDGIPEESVETCGDLPYIKSSKVITSITPLGGGMHAINYQVKVQNLGGAIGQYDLNDDPGLDDDLMINTASYTSSVPGNPGGALAGAGPWILANNQTIAIGAVHVYDLTIKTTLDLSPGSGGDNVYTACGSSNPAVPQPGEGLYNKAIIDINDDGIPDDTSVVCSDIDINVTGLFEGRVFNDINGNGIQNMGDPGINGVIVSLYNCNGVLIKKDTTDINGEYQFDGLISGDYFLRFDYSQTPYAANYAWTFRDIGLNDLIDSDVDASGITICTHLDIGEREATIDAGLVELASYGDFVWHDRNGDGMQSFGEEGVKGVNVILYDASTHLVVKTTTTDNNGLYLFNKLMPIDYYAKLTLPNGWIVTDPNLGPDFKDSDVDNSNGVGTTATTHLNPGEDDRTWDIGLLKCSMISGRVFFDVDLDGVFDPNENGINGLDVFLINAMTGATVSSTRTQVTPGTPSDDGFYKFSCVKPGMYYVRFERPGHLAASEAYRGGNPDKDSDITHEFGINTTSKISISSDNMFLNIGAGFQIKATMGDYVWLDGNSNGLQDSGEQPIEGVKVYAYKPDGTLVSESKTESNGQYTLDGIAQGDYFIKFDAPTSYGFTGPHAGNDEIDNDVDGTNGSGTTRTYRILAGDNQPSIDAGLIYQVLSLEWLGFDGKYNGAFTELNWKTGVELNNDYFEVERRHESENKFTVIAKVSADKDPSHTSHEYTLDDYDINKSQVYYYRIKQVDRNGIGVYSKTISVRVNSNKDMYLNIYPNPTDDLLYVELSIVADSEFEIKIFDESGKNVMTIPNFEFSKDGFYKETINTSLLIPGHYNLQVKDSKNIVNRRFTITR